MYVREMQRVSPMPLRDGNNVTFAFSYINLGYVNLLAPNWQNFSMEMGSETAGFLFDVITTNLYGGHTTATATHARNQHEDWMHGQTDAVAAGCLTLLLCALFVVCVCCVCV